MRGEMRGGERGREGGGDFLLPRGKGKQTGGRIGNNKIPHQSSSLCVLLLERDSAQGFPPWGFLLQKVVMGQIDIVKFGRRPTATGRIFYIKYFNFVL